MVLAVLAGVAVVGGFAAVHYRLHQANEQMRAILDRHGLSEVTR